MEVHWPILICHMFFECYGLVNPQGVRKALDAEKFQHLISPFPTIHAERYASSFVNTLNSSHESELSDLIMPQMQQLIFESAFPEHFASKSTAKGKPDGVSSTTVRGSGMGFAGAWSTSSRTHTSMSSASTQRTSRASSAKDFHSPLSIPDCIANVMSIRSGRSPFQLSSSVQSGFSGHLLQRLGQVKAHDPDLQITFTTHLVTSHVAGE
eukprot:gnl/TRDRNA2_/TRDRNA2_78989_c0_seq2.p1 gnl/TRDRNA2_/TRDRNA2_78989_c0~~gnl/TRDRNA2_/TRDRNA2_78989_c0_seq2.p1  ORF type:complete len:210 (+),score=21.32 gnl/TRDRNA2_/TRDRNA2_78989_c0_seq2:53-682(+)